LAAIVTIDPDDVVDENGDPVADFELTLAHIETPPAPAEDIPRVQQFPFFIDVTASHGGGSPVFFVEGASLVLCQPPDLGDPDADLFIPDELHHFLQIFQVSDGVTEILETTLDNQANCPGGLHGGLNTVGIKKFSRFGATLPTRPPVSTAVVPDGVVGTPTVIDIQAKLDAAHDQIFGGDEVVVTVSGANTASAAVVDNGDGTYTAQYTPAVAGTDMVEIQIRNVVTGNLQPISGSPFTSNVISVDPEVFAALSLGWGFSCGLLSDGSISCWGEGVIGGQPEVQGTDYVQIDAGPYALCGVRISGALSCWSALGPSQWNPPTSGSFVQASVFTHGCAVGSAGSVVCWGPNSDGQATPPVGTDFTQVAAGQYHSCAIKVGGGLACWGRNDFGQATPPAEAEFASVTAGSSHTCALRANGSLYCWGRDVSGEVSGTPGGASAAVDRPGPYSQVAAGWAHTCAVRADSSLDCWGDGVDVGAPTATGFVEVSGGVTHTCALTTVGAVQCWGSNSRGESTPPEIPG
jgi:hypothetical protein